MAAIGCLLPSSPAFVVLMSSSWPEDARTVNRAPILSGRGSVSSKRTSRTGSLLDEASSRNRISIVNRRASRPSPAVGLDRPSAARPKTASAAGQDRIKMGALGRICVKMVSAAAGSLLVGIASIGFSLAFQPGFVVRWLQRKRQDVLFLKPTTDLVVALTIDDGPHEDITPELLDILKENQSRATFFIVGHHMDRCPQLVERMHAEGHEVGNHTMFDEPSWRLSPTDFEQQLVAVDNRLNKFYCQDNEGNVIKWFRPGYGIFSSTMIELAKAHGYRTALGSLFPYDNLFTSQERLIAQYLLWRVYPGAVIVLHDREPQKQQTAKVLRKLLPGLRRRGYSIGSLTDLLNLRGNSH